MKHVADQRKRKWWLTPLALCLAVSLAMSPAGLSAVRAEEGNVDEAPSGVGVFWTATEEFGPASGSFWEACGVLGENMGNYWNAGESDRAPLRDPIRESMTALNKAYKEVMDSYDAISNAYNALTEEEQTAVNENGNSPKEEMDNIILNINGDGTDDFLGIKKVYQMQSQGYEGWNFWDFQGQYFEAVDDYWSAESALWWGDEEKEITGAMKAYYDAQDAGEDLEPYRKRVQESLGALEASHARAQELYGSVTEAYNALSEEVKDENVQGAYSDIVSVEAEFEGAYQESLRNYKGWNYNDIFDQYMNASNDYWSAEGVLSGDEEKGTPGAMKEYNDAKDAGKDLEPYRKKVLESIQAVKNAQAVAKKIYADLTEAYNALPEELRDEGIQDGYTWAGEDYGRIEEGGNRSQLTMWEYFDINDDYYRAREIFWKSTLDFSGDPDKNTAGAYETYMNALESKAAGLDALYKKAQESRDAVEKAYETVKAKYQAENAAYGALTKAEQQEAYDVNKEVADDFNDWVTPTYNDIHEAEIPAPPVKVGAVQFKVVGVIGGRNVTFSTDTKDAVIYYSSTTSKLTTEDKCVKNGETVLFEDFYGTIYARAYVNGSWGNVSRLILKIPVVNKPVITCDNGLVTIKTSTPSSIIYYTTDGSTPSPTNGKRLTKSGGSFTVTSNCTVKAIAVRSCFTNSQVVSASAKARKLGAPSFAVKGVIGGREVTFNSAESQGVIYYSTKTSNITTKDMHVKPGEKVLFQNYYGTVYAKTYVNGQWSNVSRLILKIPVVNKPTITAAGTGKVKISTSTPNCAIYYTTDGSTPSPTNGKKINSSSTIISVGSGKTVKAIAVRSCFTNSEVASYKQK